MAEAIGVTAGLVGIATFAFQISKEVYYLVESIQKAPQTIRELKSELVALDPILSSIQELVTSDASKFEDIRYPLHQCGMVCFHLRSLIRQCTTHSANSTISARDWVKMQYKGKTIDGYKSQLASYKATIGIALGTFNLTNSALTADGVDEIKAMIHDAIGRTQPDLEVQIEEINDKLESLAIESSALSKGLHNQTGVSTSTQTLDDREKVLKEDRLALEAEKKAMEQSHNVCTTAEQRIGGARPQLESQSVVVTFSGAHNSGLQLGQNTGTISNLRWGADS